MCSEPCLRKVFASETTVSAQLFKKGLRPPQSSVTHWNGLKLHIDQAPLQICKFALGVSSNLKHPDASLLHSAFSSATGSILHQPLQHTQLQGLCLSIKIPLMWLHFLKKFIKNPACLKKTGIFHRDWEPWPSVQTHGYFIQNWHLIDRHHFTNHLLQNCSSARWCPDLALKAKILAATLSFKASARLAVYASSEGKAAPNGLVAGLPKVLLQGSPCCHGKSANIDIRWMPRVPRSKKREKLFNHPESFIHRRCNHLIQNVSTLFIFPQHNLHDDTFCLLAFHCAKRRGVCTATNPYSIPLEPQNVPTLQNLCKCVKKLCNLPVPWQGEVPACGGSP